MRTIAFALFSSLFLLSISSCEKEDAFGDYPFLYVYDDHEIQRSEYVVLTQNGSTDIGAQGSFVMLEPNFETLIDDDAEELVLFKSFELLDENRIKISLYDQTGVGSSDTILPYNLDNNIIEIEIDNDTFTIEFSEGRNAIEFCIFTYYHTEQAAPPQFFCSPIHTDVCKELDGMEGVDYVKSTYDWTPGDSLAILYSALVYTKQ
jgi:hypothetical protein